MPGGNTRSVLDFDPFPFRVMAVEGPELVDVDGHRYVDLLGNYSAGLLGHNPIEVRRAVSAALERGWALGAMSPNTIDFARLVRQRFPSIEKVRFTNSGTEANLMALATAKQYTERSGIVVFESGYHGGVLYFGPGGTDLLVPHNWVVCRYNDVDSVEQAFARSGGDIAAVLVEPMLAASGCIPGTVEFLSALRDMTAANGSVLIFDEVMTSRLSSGGAQAALGVIPDMTTLGKYLAGGLTIGAFGGSGKIMDLFDPRSGGRLSHGGTFNNSELSAAAGIAALGETLSESILEAVNARGDELRQSLNDCFKSHGVPMCVTGWGSLMTIHGTAGPVTVPDDLAGQDHRLKELLFFALLEDGFYMARRGFIALSRDIDDAHVAQLVDVVEWWCRSIKALI